jgi:hypothetical protein
MDDDSAPRDPGPAATGADGCRFCRAVGPATPAGGWHAEVTASGAAPVRFERAFDLVVFLTELGGPAALTPTGLR